MKNSIILILLVLMAPSSLCAGILHPNGSPLRRDELQKLWDEIDKVNSTLPVMMSKEIQLIRLLIRDEKELVYKIKTIIYTKSQIDPSLFVKNIKPASVNGLCSAPDSFSMIKKGMIYTYSIYDKDDFYIGEYSITSKDCSQKQSGN